MFEKNKMNKKGFLFTITGIIVVAVVIVVLLAVFTLTLPKLIGIFAIIGALVIGIMTAKTGTFTTAVMWFVVILVIIGFVIMFYPSIIGGLENLTIVQAFRR